MPTRSQRHLREIQGVDSAGDGSGAPSPGVPTPGAGSIAVADGTASVAAVVHLSGTFNGGQSVSVGWNTDAPDSGSSGTGALAGTSSATEVAVLLAAALNGETNLTAVAVGRRVDVYASGSATTVNLSSITIL